MWRAILILQSGILNIDKPAGWTSHDVVAKVRSLLKVKKVGHTGTLDPDATGVLPVCFGKGTRIIPYLVNVDKEYDAVLRLGLSTDTQDATGKVLRTCAVPPYLSESVADTMRGFMGASMQTPPMYSAVKINGVPLYKTAREGRVIERPSRPITIHDIQVRHIQDNDISFSVIVSKGTYIRTLCADVGDRLGVGGCLLSLRRTRSGPFDLRSAIGMGVFCERYAREDRTWEEAVHPIDTALQALPALSVAEGCLEKIRHGAPVGREGVVRSDPFKKGDALRILGPDGALMAVGVALMDDVDRLDRLDRLDRMDRAIAPEQRGGPVFRIDTLLINERNTAGVDS